MSNSSDIGRAWRLSPVTLCRFKGKTCAFCKLQEAWQRVDLQKVRIPSCRFSSTRYWSRSSKEFWSILAMADPLNGRFPPCFVWDTSCGIASLTAPLANHYCWNYSSADRKPCLAGQRRNYGWTSWNNWSVKLILLILTDPLGFSKILQLSFGVQLVDNIVIRIRIYRGLMPAQLWARSNSSNSIYFMLRIISLLYSSDSNNFKASTFTVFVAWDK